MGPDAAARARGAPYNVLASPLQPTMHNRRVSAPEIQNVFGAKRISEVDCVHAVVQLHRVDLRYVRTFVDVDHGAARPGSRVHARIVKHYDGGRIERHKDLQARRLQP